MAETLRKPKSRRQRKPTPAINDNNGIVYEKTDKAKAFADTLERQFQENDINDDDADAWENIVNGRARQINTLPDDQPIRHATSEELQEILRHTSPLNKAPGCDEIGNIAVRKLPRRIAVLLNIVNAIL